MVKSIIENEKRKKMLDWRYTSISKKNLAFLYNDSKRYDESYKICIEIINEIMIADDIFLIMNVLA